MKVGAQGHLARKWDLNRPGSAGLFLIQDSWGLGVFWETVVLEARWQKAWFRECLPQTAWSLPACLDFADLRLLRAGCSGENRRLGWGYGDRLGRRIGLAAATAPFSVPP